MALDTDSAAYEKAWQNDSFNPTLWRQGPELITLTYTTMGGKKVHDCRSFPQFRKSLAFHREAALLPMVIVLLSSGVSRETSQATKPLAHAM